MSPTTIATLVGLFLFVPREADAHTHWLCSLSQDAVRLVCVADADPMQETELAPPQRSVVNGTVFPLDPQRQYSIDLWSPPTEMAFVEQLARATICYRSPACSVVVIGERWAAYSPPARLTTRAAASLLRK
ncbi:MAG: hypothetical protein WA210_00670 [Burkholderiaceae bacterium]